MKHFNNNLFTIKVIVCNYINANIYTWRIISFTVFSFVFMYKTLLVMIYQRLYKYCASIDAIGTTVWVNIE